MNISLYMQEVQNWIKEIQSDRGRDSKRLMENCDKIEEYAHYKPVILKNLLPNFSK